MKESVSSGNPVTPMLFPYEPEQYWQQVRQIIREEVSTAEKHRPISTTYDTPGLTYKPLYKIAEVCAIDLKRDIIEIKQYVYKINEDLEQGWTDVRTKVLDRDDYSKAIQDAHKLYFKDGLDLSQIKDYLVSKYHVSYETAHDISDMARK
jgi:hypothetical protein